MDFDDEVIGEVSDVPVTPEDLGDNCDIQGMPGWTSSRLQGTRLGCSVSPTQGTIETVQRHTQKSQRTCTMDTQMANSTTFDTHSQNTDSNAQITTSSSETSSGQPQNTHALLPQRHIRSWNSITRTSSQILKTDRFRTSTISACSSVVFLGGFNGEYVCRRLDVEEGDENGDERNGVITTDPYGITNHVELVENRSQELMAVVSSNDNKVRLLNMNRLEITHEFDFPWAANCSSLSPDKRLICVTGDFTDASIVSRIQETQFHVERHIDFSFACAWSPCGRFVTTGNQDLTTRVYDIRNPKKSLVVLPTIVGAVRSLRFSDDGAFLAAAEPSDFVHIYDFQGTSSQIKASSFYTDSLVDTITNRDSSAHGPLGTDAFQSQVIDFFGEIAGISFTPDGADTLYIGVSDHRYGSILEFERRKSGASRFFEDVIL
ncbi:WD40 repeat-like protein [Rhizoclosmatium globosum]|uniref:WD40 repeat-like protein n=1 Tax=Rhizoclosmatium globosum TaxID=329046 RepID=A0A1Y2D373_9FUNG|nr:WD40 repeat-like protein [Rhizoclosmatium globosum]|eukprot:ORY53739.1 WD40 repeat-like protein [Rhizoclosmatium globosum]